MALPLDYFYSLTPRAFYNIAEGFRKAQFEDYKNGWEQTRSKMWAALAPHQKKNSNLTPEKVLPFTWDKKDAELDVLTEQETQAKLAEGLDAWAKYDAKKAKET